MSAISHLAKSILFLNGPNLNLLGVREPSVYGKQTLKNVEEKLAAICENSGFTLTCKQSNREHELLEAIHQHLVQPYDFAIINPGAFTHTSVALRDAFLGVQLPFVEVHLSNVYGRESFRHHSYLSDIAEGVIVGMGTYGYELALQFVLNRCSETA